MGRSHLLLALVLASACGTPPLAEDEPVAPTPTEIGVPNGDPVSATIGAAGGTLATTDARFTVVIPPGALGADTVISIQPITNTAHGGRGDGYALSPDGQTFAQPVALRWQLTEDDLDGTAIEYATIAHQDADGYWESHDSTHDASAVTVLAPHFSHWSPSVRLYLVPNRATVMTEEFQAFQVWMRSDGYREVGRDTPFLTYVRPWNSATADRSLGAWAVNGIAGGDSTVGHVASTGPGGASFEAPEEVPWPGNTVSVSVPVRNNEGQPVAPLVSTVRIVGRGQPYGGTATWEDPTFSMGEGTRSTATVHFVPTQTLTSHVSYEVTGSVTIEIHSLMCTPKTVTLPVSADPALGNMTLWTSGIYAPTVTFSFETDLMHTTLECMDAGGAYTRDITVSAGLDCNDVPYTDLTMLSTTDASLCGTVANVNVQLSPE